MANSYFTLSLGEEYIRVIDGEVKGANILISAAAFDTVVSNLYEDETDITIKKTAELIGKLAKDSGIKKREVSIVVPDGQSYSRIIEMPMITERELISAIRYQADQFIPIPIDKVNLDVQTIVNDKKNKRMLILLVACASAVIEKVVTIVESSGFIPSSIESETSSTIRFFNHLYATKYLVPTENIELFINFGNSSTSLYVFDASSGLPLQTHNFAIGSSMMKKDIKANFRIEDAKISEILSNVGFEESSNYHLANILQAPLSALTDEITRFVLSVKEKQQKNIGNVFLFGEGSRIVNFDKQLTTLLKTQVLPFPTEQLLLKNTVTDFFKNDWGLFLPSLGGIIK